MYFTYYTRLAPERRPKIIKKQFYFYLRVSRYSGTKPKKDRNIYDRSFSYIRHIYITIGSEIAGCFFFTNSIKNSSISTCLCHIKGAQNQKKSR